MKHHIVLLSILLLCTASNAFGLDLCDADVATDAYKQKVKRLIDQQIKSKTLLSITIIPSFTPEEGIRVTENEIHHVSFQRSLWYSSVVRNVDKSPDARAPETSIPIESDKSKIDKALVDRLILVYQKHAALASPRGASGLMGLRI